MSDKVHTEFLGCPACGGTGKVPSQLPARTRPCDACRGKGIVLPAKRQQLIAKLKAKARERA
jgi:DnaJ-class molecular chaperone